MKQHISARPPVGPPTTPFRRKSRLRLLAARFAVAVLVLSLAFGGSLYLLCVFKPELVSATVQQQLIEATGLPWRIRGSIRPSLAGGLGIVARDVHIIAASTDQGHYANAARPLVQAASLRLILDMGSLLTLGPPLKHIVINEPVVSLVYDGLGRPLWLPPESAPLPSERAADASEAASAAPGTSPASLQAGADGSAETSSAATQSTNGTDSATPKTSAAAKNATAGNAASESAEVENTEAAKTGIDDAFSVSADRGLMLKSVADAICIPHNTAMLPLIIRRGSFVSYTREGKVLLSFSGVEGRFTPGAENDNLRLSAAFDLPGAGLALSFAIRARVGCEGVPAKGSLQGSLAMTPPGSRAVNAAFNTSFVWEENGKQISLPDFTLDAEGDLLSAELTADLAGGTLSGPVAIHKLSLPRWFEWARVLPPGLQAALHRLSGGFDLDMSLDKAMALNLHAETSPLNQENGPGPLRLSGTVGAPDFSAPSVVAHVSIADTPDLDALLPFLGVPGRWIEQPVAPSFDHPPLAPYPEDPPAPYDPGPSSVGYDINVAMERATVHGVTGGPVSVRIAPHMVGEVEKTRVSIEGKNLLSGSVKGHLDIDRHAILMRYEASNADLALLPENNGSDTRIAGKATGSCEIDMPMDEKGFIADDWPLRIDAAVSGLELSGLFNGKSWKLRLAQGTAKGAGSIHAVLEEGVRLAGDWRIEAKGLSTPWQPGAKDEVRGAYKGVLYWPPIPAASPPETENATKKNAQKTARRAVERVAGSVDVNGTALLPEALGTFPLSGSLKSGFDWSVTGNRLSFTDVQFKGHGSILEGEALLDISGAQSLFTASPSFSANPARLLRDGKISAPQGVRVPELLSGRLDLNLKGEALSLEKIKIEMDGAPISGDISLLPGAAAAPDAWTLRLTAQHLDLEKIFPPENPAKKQPPSSTPWNLNFFQKLSLDAKIMLLNARMGKLAFDRSAVTATANKDRFSVEINTADFYGGTSLIIAQGTVVPGSSQLTLRKGLIHMRDVALGALLYDMTGKRSYAGTAELVADLGGVLGCNADIPRKLSGNWSLRIVDGLYPAFLTSADSNLRNTFSVAAASGPMDRGVLRSNNFELSGPMVDMRGGGWFDLNTRDMDLEVSVTLAKVPTVPVRFYGNAASPRMKVRGVDMVVETVQAAGTTVFDLVMGVLELPGRAIQGIGGLFGQDSGTAGETKKNTRRQPPQTMPVRPAGSK